MILCSSHFVLNIKDERITDLISKCIPSTSPLPSIYLRTDLLTNLTNRSGVLLVFYQKTKTKNSYSSDLKLVTCVSRRLIEVSRTRKVRLGVVGCKTLSCEPDVSKGDRLY